MGGIQGAEHCLSFFNNNQLQQQIFTRMATDQETLLNSYFEVPAFQYISLPLMEQRALLMLTVQLCLTFSPYYRALIVHRDLLYW